MKKRKLLITAALPYANGPLHFGHIAGAYLPADCYARFQRMQGNEVLYICGSDEYGVAIALSAENAGRSPKEHVDIYHRLIQEFFHSLNISFDHYSRTTWPGHVETVHQFFLDLYKNGYIEKKLCEQLYSEKDKRFLADRYVVGTCPKCGFTEARGDECQKCGASYEATDLKNPRSKISGAPLILKPTEHWFLRFDLFKDKLSKWIATKNWKPNVLNFARSYIEELKPRAITRDSEWGVPVPLPEAKGKVLYVWFDAPIGYLSATREWAEKKGEKEAWKHFWCDPTTELVHFLGKDNIPFHAVFFPAMTMGQNEPYKLVDELPANEFLNLEGHRFSKSEGWIIDLDRTFKEFTPDQIRYYLASIAPESQDSDFSWKDLQNSCNALLVGKYGNLANRTLVFLQQQTAGMIPTPDTYDAESKAFLEQIDKVCKEAEMAYNGFHLRKASQIIMELATLGNVYFDAKKPWIMAKNPELKTELETTLFCLLRCLQALSLISWPIIPKAAEELWFLLGQQTPLVKTPWHEGLKLLPPSGKKLPIPHPLFKKVEDTVIQEEIDRLPKESPKPVSHFKEPVSIDEFLKMDIRVAQILTVEPVPKSKKLLKLTVDLGVEKRTVVSGIALSFPDPQILVGKKVLVVANLKPATLMGIESQGMILTADLKEAGIELLELESAAPGAVIR